MPDYLDHIKRPMDFSTMSKKLENFEYLSLESMEADFTQMVDNCLSYNERDTIFFRLGVKMRDQGGSLIRQARRQAEVSGPTYSLVNNMSLKMRSHGYACKHLSHSRSSGSTQRRCCTRHTGESPASRTSPTTN